MNKFTHRLLLSCIGIGYTIFGSAQNKLSGRILDEHSQGFDAAVVMLISLPDNILVETTLTDSEGQGKTGMNGYLMRKYGIHSQSTIYIIIRRVEERLKAKKI